MDRSSFKNIGNWSLTLAGLAGLQFPCLVSAASPSSPLAKLKSLGFPFNMSAGILNEHFSFCPENLFQGRYHTLVTNLFNHNGKVYFCLNQNNDFLDRVLHSLVPKLISPGRLAPNQNWKSISPHVHQ